MNDNRNLILAIVSSVVILVGFEFYSAWRYPDAGQTQSNQTTASDTATPKPSAIAQAPGSIPTPDSAQVSVPSIPGGATPSAAEVQMAGRDILLKKSARVKIETPNLHGSLSLVGGRIDDLTLVKFREELDKTSPEIVLLSPSGAKGAYFADYGWVAEGVTLPGPTTVWSPSTDTLSPDQPVTLSWDNGQGLTFKRTYAIDENYMFSVTQGVVNKSERSVTLHPYGLMSRHGRPEVTGFYILHEGMLGVFDETLKEVDYDEMQETHSVQTATTGGWLGITDKYWLVALVPDQKIPVTTRFTYRNDSGLEKFQADFMGQPLTVQAGTSGEVTSHLFTGAKEVKVLDAYEENLGIARFDLAIDFGWFYFLTKPIFYTMIYINEHVGNFGVSILLLTVLIKLLFFPLANKSYVSMSKMKKLQPEMVKLRERFGDDKTKLNQEMMALYKREKANPASGCLPMLVQIPVFFSLYKVLFVTIEMRHAPFFGWIQDLSAPDPTNVFNLFGLIPWDPGTVLPEPMWIGVWPLFMGITMYLQQKLNPQPADPVQAKVFMFLPILFTFLLARFPAGLVVYWAWNNLLSIIQQKVIMVKMGVK
ncbi:MAG: membrane protein insertase YidC [Rhodospirillales bacterium]|nr:membrane protein insertase YidC [Rhodospirillales bacterium]